MEFNERILKIIDTYEVGSKSRFAAKTGMQNQVYNVLRPGYNPGKITIDRIISAYPNISVKWLTSDIGEMTIANTEEKTDKSPIVELPDHLTAHQVISHILKYTGTDSLVKLSIKLNVKLSYLNQVYNGEKTMGGRLAQKIRKVYPELPYQWITTGKNPFKSQGTSIKINEVKPKDQVKPKDKVKQDNIKPQIETQVEDPAFDNTLEVIDNKSYIQEMELQVQTMLKINKDLLSDYQKAIKINQRLNNVVIELTEKVLSFNSKIR